MIRVLVVDDDEDLLEMVTLMLTTNSMLVTSLNAGALVFETISAHAPDVLVMDIFLGDSDGRQICQQIKTAPYYTGFPIVLYSAGEIANSSIVESHADFFLRKPFQMKHLIATIQQAKLKSH